MGLTGQMTRRDAVRLLGEGALAMAGACLAGCAPDEDATGSEGSSGSVDSAGSAEVTVLDPSAEEAGSEPNEVEEEEAEEDPTPTAAELFAALDITEDYRESFVHGEKGAAYQKYIVLHDTEGEGSPESVVSWWDSNGNLVAAHFVVAKDGHMVQCVPLDKIAHHAGFGDTGHNELYGVQDESRDDKLGTTSIGSWASDYGMNSYSIGIEMVHVGGSGDYPTEQLDTVDALIAYIDAYYGFESAIIDHKAWRTGNSDTSAEFAGYLANYQDHRTHADA